jgi:hypothetical protein
VGEGGEGSGSVQEMPPIHGCTFLNWTVYRQGGGIRDRGKV